MVKLSSSRLVGQHLTPLRQGVLLAIDNCTVDLHNAPKSLDEVIQAGYLNVLPKDFSLEASR
jgi:hypothetical protein